MNIVIVDDATAQLLRWAPFVLGWLAGWAMLWRLRPLPRGGPHRPMSVIVPARDEERSLPDLLDRLTPQLGSGDELIVVDDHSTDATAVIAVEAGATVVRAGEPPPGWLGKPNACHHGVAAATTERLVFLDADVRPGPQLLDGLAAAVERTPGALVSVQPWHEPGSSAEHLSMLCNVTALMGCARFSVFGERVEPRVAFGPVLAVARDTYERAGGHAHPTVRGAHTEDIALARTIGGVELFGDRRSASFRMYPGGLRDLVDGWTRSIATGAASAPRWAALLTAGWVWSLAAAPLLGLVAYVASALQCLVLSRRAGRFSPVLSLAYPIALLVFLYVVLRSGWRFARKRDVAWKGRRVPAR